MAMRPFRINANYTVARVERSETRGSPANTHNHPGFAALNPGYGSGRRTPRYDCAFLRRMPFHRSFPEQFMAVAFVNAAHVEVAAGVPGAALPFPAVTSARRPRCAR